MKNELIGVKNGIELYAPVPENEHEKRELEFRQKRFYNFLGEMIRKYGHEVLQEIEETKATENKTE